MISIKNPYETLGIAADADHDDIRRAFRRLALKHHPDVNTDPDATQTFQEINSAYQTLSDPDRRAQYDRAEKRILKESLTCPACGRRKNPNFNTCYQCRPSEETCPKCGGFKRPQFKRCYRCRFRTSPSTGG